MSNSYGRTMKEFRFEYEFICVLWIDDEELYSEIVKLFSCGYLCGWRIEDCDRLSGWIRIYRYADERWW